MALTMTPNFTAAHAAARFGLGAQPDELARIGKDAQGWALAQITTPRDTTPLFQNMPTPHDAAAILLLIQKDRAAKKERKQRLTETGTKAAKNDDFVGKKQLLALVSTEIQARVIAGLATRQPLHERLLRFWANHFSISVARTSTPYVGLLEREIIRPNLFTNFSTMLQAVMEHPGMLYYLDNATSIGPNSFQGIRRSKGLNENLAREILELHTLGVDGGYHQDDVIGLAKILTGWTTLVPWRDEASAGKLFFNDFGHEPGTQTVLGKQYPDTGKTQGDAVLRDLAHHPATARHIATKLARHFIADNPPPAAVDRIATVFQNTGGDLAQVTAAVIREPEAWRNPLEKFRSSEDFLLAAGRSLSVNPDGQWLRVTYGLLGQMPYSAGSPAGWGDKTEDWAGPDAVMKRISWNQSLANRYADGIGDIAAWATTIFGDLLSADTLETLRHAASRPQALTLALSSPEMLRR
jgi:uncharacterized protein (DUF1800 family)